MFRICGIVFGLVLIVGSSASVFGATYTVTKTADTSDGTCDSDCSLREAVVAANATIDNDIVAFSALFNAPQTITLGGTEIVFANNGTLTITGPGADKLTISGNNASRIFASGANVVVNINNLRFTGGNGVGATNTGRGGAIYNVGGTMVVSNSIITGNSAANGGAFNNAASSGPAVPANLTIINCVVSNNSSTSSGGAMQNFSTSFLNVINSTISGNTSNLAGLAGGGIQANGTVTITNSTISGNNAPAGTGGGGIIFNGVGLTLNNVTISGNTAANGAGGLHKSTATLNANVRNTIISGNSGAAANPDALGAFNSQGNNIIGVVGTSTGWVASDLQNVNPLLGPLGSYGGIGQTYPLLTTSPALNAGQNCVTDLSCAIGNPPAAITTDQRGAARPFGGTLDIGAFESSTAYIAELPSAKLNQPYTYGLTQNVGAFAYTQMGGAPPNGVTVNTGGVVASIAGTPTQSGTFDFGVNLTNGANSALVNYRLVVTSNAVNASVGGRVLRADGSGIKGVLVTIADMGGNQRRILTSSFGYYSFDNLNIGETYTVTVNSKSFTFVPSSQVVLVNDNISNLNFTAQP